MRGMELGYEPGQFWPLEGHRYCIGQATNWSYVKRTIKNALLYLWTPPFNVRLNVYIHIICYHTHIYYFENKYKRSRLFLTLFEDGFVFGPRRLDSKMAAAISSGSSKILLKRFFKPSWMASTSGLEHPICMLVSACRISIALATGLMVAEYSAKKANSDGLSLWHTKRFNSVWGSHS